jgi:seryl-tRNA synthetase
MIDVRLLRENPQLVKSNIKKKFQEERLPLVDEVLELDGKWKALKQKGDDLRKDRNEISKKINEVKKSKDEKSAKALIKRAKELPDKIAKNEIKVKELEKKRDYLLNQIPNILHESVPIGEDESKNVEIERIGRVVKLGFPVKNHVELGEALDVLDFTRSAKVAGKGFYYLKGDLALLNQALLRFTIDFMKLKGYTYIEPPLMLRKDVLGAALDTEEFKNTIYEIAGEDLALIGTSEYSLLGMHAGETFTENDLPKKYFSYSMCFRKEIGSHGVNEKGLYRTHQFNKVEQFIFCRPEDSYKYYDELMKNSIELYKKLEIPTRVLEICSGDMATWKAKSADLEAWRPTTKSYEEVCSLSNCTDFQARNLGIKVQLRNNERVFVHTLNNTAVATSRALIAIMENNQQEDGSIKIQKVLQPYMNGQRIISARKKSAKEVGQRKIFGKKRLRKP